MTTIFIHGVPDTTRVWAPLLAELGCRDAVTLALPGFGAPHPPAFNATKEDYLGWLIAAIEKQPPPRDLVAHDWGFILMMRVLGTRPELIRSWAGGGAPFTPDYTWHPTARIWQTPGVGEKAMQRMTPNLATDMLKKAGLPDTAARDTASAIDPLMQASILALYRSGRDVFREWGSELAISPAPGLVLWGARDPYAAPEFGRRVAETTGATVLILDCGHWWQTEMPAATAAALQTHWTANKSTQLPIAD